MKNSSTPQIRNGKFLHPLHLCCAKNFEKVSVLKLSSNMDNEIGLSFFEYNEMSTKIINLLQKDYIMPNTK